LETAVTDIHGLERAKQLGLTLREVGHRVVLENEYVRVWEILLQPGEIHEFHLHYHPYLIVSLGGGENEIETIFGDKIGTEEALGSTVYIGGMPPVHRLTNKADVPYLSRLIELKHVTWRAEQTELPAGDKH
jgi:hypothetical protein